MLKRTWEGFSSLGVEGLPVEEQRKLRLLNQCAVIAAVTNFGFGLGYVTDPARFWQGIVLNFGAGVLQLTVLAWTRKRHPSIALAQFLVLCNVQLAGAVLLVGPSLGFQYYFLAFISVVFLVTPRRLAAFYPFVLLSLLLYLYFTFIMRDADAAVTIDPLVAVIVRAVTIVSTSGTLVLIGYLFDADTREAEEKLAAEHARSENLLLNILPKSISERLKGGQKAIADGFAEVSVLFADIVGFTELSGRLPPEELVRVLNDVFSRFDDLTEKYGLEKIKTIGDAYMVASGLPEPRVDHAEAMVRMALAMCQVLEGVNRESGHDLQIRIGVHSGPVVAGVIGKRKFVYDLWGDTVNIASRMESHGLKGAVQLSEATAVLVRGVFVLEPRGAIHVKGKGSMSTYLVVGERS